jgi:hypothetical protein
VTPEDIKYINELRESDRRYFEAELRAVRRAVDIYNASNNERWTGANEFRGQLKDQASSFVTRRELWGAVIAIISIVLAVVQLLIKFNGE